MKTTLVPASQGYVIVTDPAVVVSMTVPDESAGDSVELLNALDSSFIAQAVKVGLYWKASFTLPKDTKSIDITARVKRGANYSRLTFPTFKIIYDPTATVTDQLAFYGLQGVIRDPVFTNAFAVTGSIDGFENTSQYKLDFVLLYTNATGSLISFPEISVVPDVITNGYYNFSINSGFTIPSDAVAGAANIYVRISARLIGAVTPYVFVRDTVKLPFTVARP